MAGIVSYGAYIPFNRLPRAEISKVWGGPHLPGEKAVAGFDEDAVTMAVAAAIDCVKGINCEDINGVYFASTSSPYLEKQVSALIAQVLNLKKDVWTMDFAGSLRCGTNALKAAMDAVKGGSAENILVCASDVRPACAKGDKEMNFGDGAASFLISNKDVSVEVENTYTRFNELMDVWRSDQDPYVRSWEDVFIYAKGYTAVVSSTVLAALKKVKLEPSDFSRVALYSPNARQLGAVARKVGFSPEVQIRDVLHLSVGNTGTAMAMMALIAALEEVEGNERLLFASYGDGCDVFIMKTTDKIRDIKNRRGIKEHLASKKTMSSYSQYLTWRKQLETEPPRRVPLEGPSASALLRDNKSGLAFYGVKCLKCGTPQYPPQRVCLNCGSKDQFEDYCFANKIGKVTAFSHDMLGATLDPPITGATIDFEGGGRIKLDMTDRVPEEVKVGIDVEMTFRKLRYVNGIYDYWWKCRPIRSSM